MGWQDAPLVDAPPAWSTAPEVSADTQGQAVSLADKMVGGWVGRTLMGMASPILAGVQAFGGETGRTAVANLEAMKQRGMKAEGKDGYDFYGLMGSMLPITGVASAVGKVLPAATTVLGRAGVGAAQGAAAAAAQPSSGITAGDYFPEKSMQIAAGGAVGGTVPLAIDAAKGIGSIVKKASQPFTESGRAAILKEFREGLLDNDPALKAKVIAALEQPQTLVPGSPPTSGEVLSSMPRATGLAAHEKDIARLKGVSTQFADRFAQQEAARLATLQNIGKTPQDLARAVQARSAEAATKYGLAGQESIQPDAAFTALMERPSMQKAASRARDLAREAGESFSPTSVQSLHYMKMAMDDLIKNPERFSIGAKESQAIAKTQNDFVQWLGQKSPAYNAARESYKVASGPINRMEIGQELEKTLRTPLGTSERRGMFAKAVEESPRTIKRATGQSMFSNLEDVLQPHESDAVRRVAQELARKDAYERLAGLTKLSGADAIPGDVGLRLPNILSRPAMIANFALKHAGKTAEGKIAQMAAAQHLNPQAMADALKDVPARYRPMIDALMQQLPAAAAGTMVGRTQ